MSILANKLIDKENITEVIPQRPPMVMIDALVVCDQNFTETTFEIIEDNIFSSNGYFGEPGLVENIAQTAAARIGYIYKQANSPIPIGYIAAVKDLKINFLPKTGDTISTRVKVTNQILDITVIRGSVLVGSDIVAECEMKIFAKRLAA